MSFDELQSEWQSHDHALPLNVDFDQLVTDVRKRQKQLRSALVWRDVREVGIAALLAAFFLRLGILSGAFFHYATSAACLWVATFMLVDRWIQHRRHPNSDSSLESWLETSLAQVDHQIWLLRNIFWWYLLPLGVAILPGFVGVGWNAVTQEIGVIRNFDFGSCLMTIFGCLVFYGVYWLNQVAVKCDLQPRHDELKRLIDLLKQ